MTVKPCPDCGSTDRKQETGEYALMGLTGGRLQLHLDAPNTPVVTVSVSVCRKCGYVTLREAA